MKFERLESGDFMIEGVFVRRQVFFMLEPHYSEPMDTIYMKYEQGVGRTIATTEKRYRIDGVWEEGERYFRRLHDFKKASGIVETQINQELAETNVLIKSVKEKSYRDSRRDEYPPLTDLIVALWENLIEKKSKKNSGVEAIQKLRKDIKSKYPTENINALSEDETKTD